MDFALSPEVDRIRLSIREFVQQRLIPLESDRATYDEHENITEALLETLRAEAKAAGLWALNMPKDRGGLGLKLAEIAPCYEEMNRSIFGPVVFNAAAPDDGNMRVILQTGTEAQKARWLQPIIDGDVRSAFAMTEPDGCGSDPSLTYTTATRTNTGWKVHGRKWFITGAGAAKHFILIARTSDDPRKGLSALLFHADQPGWRIVRRIPIMGPEEHGGHCELEFDGLEIPRENILLGEGDGNKVLQTRLGPARLTHCMRWMGLARRSLEIALAYTEQRASFGAKLIDHESVQGLLGEAALQVQIARMLTMQAAWKLDQGDYARKEVSQAKIVAADALQQAVDTSLQLLGAKGYSKDTPLEWIYRYARQARLVDGASEVHRMVIAQNLRRDPKGFFDWGSVKGTGHG